MSPSGKDLFVVMVTWNGTADTLEAIGSLRRGASDLRIVLVDNGSTEAEKAPLRALDDVILIENASNLGMARANNLGVARALAEGAEYVLLLNNDTLVQENMVERLLDALDADPSVGIVAPKMYYNDEPNTIWFAGGTINLWKGDSSHVGMGERDLGQYSTTREVDYVSSCAMLVRRDVLRQVGQEDPVFFMYFGETDFCLRARGLGWKVVFVPEAVLWHKVSRAMGSGSSRYWSQYTKSRLLFVRKHATVAQKVSVAVYLGLDGPRMLVHFLLRGKRDCIVPYLRGIRDGAVAPLDVAGEGS